MIKFGDYVEIEMKRYGVPNEMFLHKVIGTLMSNTYVDVPVQSPATASIHSGLVDVVACICCGIDETEVLKYRLEDVKKVERNNNPDFNYETEEAIEAWNRRTPDVVHCGECEYVEKSTYTFPDGDTVTICKCGRINGVMTADDYCSFGKRKEQEN